MEFLFRHLIGRWIPRAPPTFPCSGSCRRSGFENHRFECLLVPRRVRPHDGHRSRRNVHIRGRRGWCGLGADVNEGFLVERVVGATFTSGCQTSSPSVRSFNSAENDRPHRVPCRRALGGPQCIRLRPAPGRDRLAKRCGLHCRSRNDHCREQEVEARNGANVTAAAVATAAAAVAFTAAAVCDN